MGEIMLPGVGALIASYVFIAAVLSVGIKLMLTDRAMQHYRKRCRGGRCSDRNLPGDRVTIE